MGTCLEPELTEESSNDDKVVRKDRIDYKIEKVENKHKEQIKELIKDAFTNRTEPLGKTAPPGFWDTFLPVLLDDGRVHEASSVAVMNNGTVIGVCLGQDMTADVPEPIMEGLGALPQTETHDAMWILTILEEVTGEFKADINANGPCAKGVVLELTLSAVHQDYARKGVVSALKQNLLDIGTKSGYKYVISEATNKLSQGQNAKLGFEIQKEIFYKEWEYGTDSKIFPFAKRVDELGHDKLALMVYSFEQ